MPGTPHRNISRSSPCEKRVPAISICCSPSRAFDSGDGEVTGPRDGCLSDSRIRLDVSTLRVRDGQDDADGCLCDLARVPRLSRIASAQDRRLLRVLFVRFRQMSSHSAVAGLLWKRNPVRKVRSEATQTEMPRLVCLLVLLVVCASGWRLAQGAER